LCCFTKRARIAGLNCSRRGARLVVTEPLGGERQRGMAAMLVTNFRLKYFLYKIVCGFYQLADVGRIHPMRDVR
jgi:hypothetical protein